MTVLLEAAVENDINQDTIPNTPTITGSGEFFDQVPKHAIPLPPGELTGPLSNEGKQRTNTVRTFIQVHLVDAVASFNVQGRLPVN